MFAMRDWKLKSFVLTALEMLIIELPEQFRKHLAEEQNMAYMAVLQQLEESTTAMKALYYFA